MLLWQLKCTIESLVAYFTTPARTTQSKGEYNTDDEVVFTWESHFQKIQNQQARSLITSAQVEQLNLVRSRMTLDQIKQFPKIRVEGERLDNVIPGAGIFTVQVQKKEGGEIKNLVVMLSTPRSISEFEQLCSTLSTFEKEYWAEGHVVPAKAGYCYSFFMVTSFRLSDRNLNF